MHDLILAASSKCSPGLSGVSPTRRSGAGGTQAACSKHPLFQSRSTGVVMSDATTTDRLQGCSKVGGGGGPPPSLPDRSLPSVA